MDLDKMPLSAFEVDCDGSACGSGGEPHVHPPQNGLPGIARVIVRDGKRKGYEGAQGITRLVEREPDGTLGRPTYMLQVRKPRATLWTDWWGSMLPEREVQALGGFEEIMKTQGFPEDDKRLVCYRPEVAAERKGVPAEPVPDPRGAVRAQG
jgi:hypothetical protein